MTNLSGANLNKREATGPKGEGRDIPSTFPQYPEYKDSGIEWLGEVPVLWEVVKLKRLCHMQSGDFISPSDIEEDGEYPVYGGNGHRGFTPSYTHNGLYPLVGRQGALCGNVNYAKGKFWASEHAVVASPDDDVSPVWLGELLRAMDLNQYSITAAQPGLAVEKIKNLFTPKPPLSEQSQIAAFLGYETARIDALVEEQQRLIALLKEKRQAVISHAVTKGLNSDVPMKDSGVEWLGEVPEHWEIKRLKHISSSIKAGPFGSALTKDMYQQEGYRVYGQEQVIPGDFSVGDYYISDESFKSLFQYEVKEGDILISCVGTFGKIAIVPGDAAPGIINPRLIRLRIHGVVDPSYLEVVLKSQPIFEQFSVLSRGGTMDIINVGTLSEIFLPVPIREEQEKIFKYVITEKARIDSLMAQAKNTSELLKERRSALISAAVTGKIDVRGWQPPEVADVKVASQQEAV